MSAARYETLERPECEDDFTDSDEEKGAERTSDDVRRHDHETLTAEEEAERLLIGGEKSSERQEDSRKQRRKDGRKQSKKRRKGEDSELMYKMEEGGPRSSSEESSGRSSEVDMHRLGEIQSRQKVCLDVLSFLRSLTPVAVEQSTAVLRLDSDLSHHCRGLPRHTLRRISSYTSQPCTHQG